MGSRIRPPPLEDVVGQDAVPDVQIVHVRDLVLPSRRGSQASDEGENLRIIHINPRDAIRALGSGRFLLDGNDPSSLKFRHAKPFGMGNLLQHQFGSLLLSAERFHIGSEVVLKHVVRQDHQHFLFPDEFFGQRQRLRDAARTILHLVGKPGSERLAAAKEPDNVAHVFHAGDDQNVLDSAPDHLSDGMVDHRIPSHRKQVFVGHFGQRE